LRTKIDNIHTQPRQPDQPQQKSEHHGKEFAKKVGNAVTFGAGATAGSDAVNAVIKNV